MPESIKREEEVIQPIIEGSGQNEVTLHVVNLAKAKTAHWIELTKYVGGIIILLSITFCSLYAFTFSKEEKSYEDSVKIIFLIAGAIVGSLYTTTTDRGNK